MPSKFYVWRDGQFVEKDELPPPEPRVHVIQDTIEHTFNPITGGMTDSKSHLRRLARERGLVECGGEKMTQRRGSDDKPDPKLRSLITEVVNSRWR